MARKLLKPVEDPPAVSSSEDDGVEFSSDEGEEQISASSSEESKPKDPFTKTQKAPSTASKQKSDSDSGSEDGSDSEAEPSPKATAVSAVKSKNKESNESNPAVKSGKKRAAGEGTSTEVSAKKAKNVSASGRLWSEEDEISLLQGMIDYKADTGKSPYDDMNGFFEFMKKAISFEVSKVQFGDKIRGLKKKYLGKSKNGKDVIFTKAHDKECLKLATHIWGSDGLGLESAVKSSVQSKKKVDSVVESAAVKSPVPSKKKVDSVVESAAVKSPVPSKKKVDSSAVKSPVQSKKKVDSMVEPSAVKSPKKNEKKKVDPMVEKDKEMLRSDGIVLESAKSNGKLSNVESLEPEGEKVEEDKEVLIHGGGSESPSWFEKSFIFGSVMSFGLDEQFVKQRWSKVPVETKKRIEEKLKIVQAKEFDLWMMKTEIMRDVSTVLYEAI